MQRPALDFAHGGVAGFTFEPPAFLQHLLVDGALVTHYTPFEAADGPYLFS